MDRVTYTSMIFQKFSGKTPRACGTHGPFCARSTPFQMATDTRTADIGLAESAPQSHTRIFMFKDMLLKRGVFDEKCMTVLHRTPKSIGLRISTVTIFMHRRIATVLTPASNKEMSYPVPKAATDIRGHTLIRSNQNERIKAKYRQSYRDSGRKSQKVCRTL
ncbi:hypothetical protein QAD02_008439 [Eretmocerus hayati]|uniref:Uncharacterized protein n=1 Tax=Eretmocerus hayati TaxID=131215 RepID=A0ACC2N8V0_9HYME|nr:hypothetical protein QAD02_008439 [Eretmocerus hayati]